MSSAHVLAVAVDNAVSTADFRLTPAREVQMNGNEFNGRTTGSLSEALEKFNRKERNLLVRAIPGHRVQPLYLHCDFRREIASELQLGEIPETAWWATDYHINWIAGALALLAEGSGDHQRWDNKKGASGGLMIEGNQEDVDLVIAFGSELIFVEAKGDSNFDGKQLASKLERLDLVRKFYDCIKDKILPVNFHFLLISPPNRRREDFTFEWPKWARKGNSVSWIALPLSDELLEVGRCDAEMRRKVSTEYWRIF